MFKTYLITVAEYTLIIVLINILHSFIPFISVDGAIGGAALMVALLLTNSLTPIKIKVEDLK